MVCDLSRFLTGKPKSRLLSRDQGLKKDRVGLGAGPREHQDQVAYDSTMYLARSSLYQVIHRVSTSIYGHRTDFDIGSRNHELGLDRVAQKLELSVQRTQDILEPPQSNSSLIICQNNKMSSHLCPTDSHDLSPRIGGSTRRGQLSSTLL